MKNTKLIKKRKKIMKKIEPSPGPWFRENGSGQIVQYTDCRKIVDIGNVNFIVASRKEIEDIAEANAEVICASRQMFSLIQKMMSRPDLIKILSSHFPEIENCLGSLKLKHPKIF